MTAETEAELRARLEEAEQRFRGIFDESLDVIIVVDIESGVILAANEAAQRVLGYAPASLHGARFSILFAPESESDDTSMSEIRAHGAVFASQAFRHADGSSIPMDVTATDVPWSGGRAILVTIREVTERLRAERDREALIRELDAFAHTVAHDLKAPLTILTGATDLLMAHFGDLQAADRNRQLAAIGRASDKMAGIIDELLLLAGVRNRQVPLVAFDMSPVVREAWARLAPAVADSGALLTVQDDLPWAVGHAPWVEEVWANYLSNAIRYGGKPPVIEVGADDAGNGLCRYWVRDYGHGITPDGQARLFTPFTQLEERRALGHGLGLSIVRRIVEKLGGEAGVESEVGAGSRFYFTLPKA